MTSNAFSLRDYQIEALEVIHNDLQTDPVVLLQAVTGAGKTVTVARLVNRYWFDTDRRFLVLAHKQELVEQFIKTFRTMTNIPVHHIGVACGSLNRWEVGRRLTIATVQTFVNSVDDFKGADLTIIDEAHRVSIGTDSQYDKVLKKLNDLVPSMRVLGITATPSRLGHGFIYGDRCRPGAKNLFPRLNHQIKYKTLLEQGYLCRLRGEVAHADSLTEDLAGVNTSGDYVLDALGEVMTKEIHLATAAEAINQFCAGYKFVCVFCCTIDHAEKLRAIIGDEATTVHSQLTPLERGANMRAWQSGQKRICTSVNILAEGFDFPPLDCLVMARPTLSSTLFIQAVGRALRISPGKDHAFLLDLTDNTSRFGTDLDKVRVTIPKAATDHIAKDPLKKLCPMCQGEVFVNLRLCPHCEYEWPAQEIIEANKLPDLKEVVFEAEPPQWVTVNQIDINIHESKKSGKMLGRIMFYYGSNMYRPKFVSLWLCLPDYYQGFAVEKARATWKELTGSDDLPNTVDEFIELEHTIVRPSQLLLDDSGEYAEIKELKFQEVAF